MKKLLSDNPVTRATDPGTSKLAETEINASGQRATQQHLLMDAVHRYPNHTSAELARKIGVDRYIAARRLPELRDAGLVRNGDSRKCGVTGRKAITWESQPFQRDIFT